MKTLNSLNTYNAHSFTDLQEKLKNLKNNKKEFLENKGVIIKKLISSREVGENDHLKLFEDIKEIDREVAGLEQIITTSINIAVSIINPVKEREKSINNISSTMDLLKIDNDIKSLLSNLKHEKKIENKINIILEASNLIKFNHTVFDIYREHFLKESQDVLNYLKNNLNENKSKLFNLLNSEGKLNIKECNSLINEIDKNSILTYKLTNETLSMENFFSIISEYVIKAICKNKISEFSDSLNSLLQNSTINSVVSNSNNSVKLKEIIETLSRNFIVKIFLKIAAIINERKTLYYKEFNDYKIFNLLVEKILLNIEPSIEKMVGIILKISEKLFKDNYCNDLDFICGEKINVMTNFEKFRFYVFTLLEKISMLPNLQVVPISSTNNHPSGCHNFFHEFFKKFNSLLYDLGEQYANTEIKFMKNKLLYLFKEESLNFSQNLEKNLNSNFDELAGVTLSCIDDFFYILKISGARAIASLNLQLSLAIVNNIKSILSEELLELLDLKISALMIKTENRNSQYSEIKYYCKDEPTISYKFTYPNLFLISCINSIDQSRNNISLLFEELKNLIMYEIIESQAFNHRDVILGVNSEIEEQINENIKYFKKNDIDLINITFSDVEMHANRYEDFLMKKIRTAFEYLYPSIKSSVDLLNSANFLIDGRNIHHVELSESFSGKFLEETEKVLKQWKTQLSEGGFNKFLTVYAEYVSVYIEKLLFMKNYSTFGAIVLEKVINHKI
jgi:hypothetical protein